MVSQRRSYHLEDGGVAPNDEGQTAETLDTMGDSHWQLLVQVFGTALRSDEGRKQLSDKDPERNTQSRSVSSLPKCGVHPETSQNTAASLRWVAPRPKDKTQTYLVLLQEMPHLTHTKATFDCPCLTEQTSEKMFVLSVISNTQMLDSYEDNQLVPGIFISSVHAYK